jgi:hypothetical protein
MPTLESRVTALEASSPPSGQGEVTLISFFTRRDGCPCEVEPTAMREMLGTWQLEREAGEELEMFRERALSLCPRPPGRMQALVEVVT